MKQHQHYPAIRRFLGWWVVTGDVQGQIVEIGDLDCVIRVEHDKSVRLAQSAILDTHISRLYTTDEAMRKGARS